MLSIIIPVLNEAETINKLLQHLSENLSKETSSELILVDGGSSDGTWQIIKDFTKTSSVSIQLFSSEKGRTKQMNIGAKNAKGDIFYFLHADSFPPKNFDKYILAEVKKGNPAGCFRMKFDNNHWWLKLTGLLTKLSWRACRGGDQSQFITKDLFNEIGGYDERFVIYEDNILINELYKRKKFVVIQHWLITSARLYKQKGIWNLQYHFCIIYFKRWMGADAAQLNAYYVKHIKRSKKETLATKKPQEAFLDK